MRTSEEEFKENCDKSNRAHEVAKREIYPVLFNSINSKLVTIECTTNTGDISSLTEARKIRRKVLDCELGVDCIVTALEFFPDLDVQEMKYIVSERFLMYYWRNIPIRETEFCKLHSMPYMLVGWFDKEKNRFKKWIWIPKPGRVATAIKNKSIGYVKKEGKNFRTVDIEDVKAVCPDYVEGPIVAAVVGAS
ncbi:hypothetical protein [Paenibacillus gansuensis]|uniref:Uncharacterized protein n=1 Tax=Paenibacillus gansuensis TaxID=306542 RepID=A0ABW5PFN7_9BACL